MDDNGDWTYSGTFKVATNQPIGLYQARLEAEDSYAGIGSYTTSLNITDNYPEIHGFWINDLTTQEQISIKYGDNLVFTFNVSDLEDTYPKYVTVSLLNEENNWYNITRMYTPGSEIVVRSEDLVSGVWYVYLLPIQMELPPTLHLIMALDRKKLGSFQMSYQGYYPGLLYLLA